MSISNKFHLFVASTTIAIAHWLSAHVIITAVSITSRLPSWLKSFDGTLTVYIGSIAFYQILASLLRFLLGQSSTLRKLLFGNEFLEGTWIGAYGNAPEMRFTVEHYEQTVDGIVIRGYAFTEAKVLHADWISKSVSFDSDTGKLTYSYDCDVLANKTSHQGIAFFSIQRSSTTEAANGMIGYSADLVDGARSTNLEFKLSDKQIEIVEALEAARNRFII